MLVELYYFDYFIILKELHLSFVFENYQSFISCVFYSDSVEHNKVEIQRQKHHCGRITVYLDDLLLISSVF